MTDIAHKDLVERAVRWLRTTRRCKVVFSEMTTASPETPDAIGWGSGGHSEVVEVKVSRADFFCELRKKAHSMRADAGMGCMRWYMTPPELLHEEDVPAWCGLVWAQPKRIVVVKHALVRVGLPEHVVRHEVQMLTSALRRLELDVAFDHGTGRWESYDNHKARKKMEAQEREEACR